jgi:hypothetical protein
MSIRVLVSFHFHRDTDLDELVNTLGGDVDLFADSGAYSAFSAGAAISVQDYAQWLRTWAHLFTARSNLDVIGDPDASAAHHRTLTEAGLSVIPVFHLGEPFTVLEDMCEHHGYVALGGLVPYLAGDKHRTPLLAWLVKAHMIARKRGAVLHGFGLTSAQLIKDLPFYSLDSSSYTFGRRFGLAYLWDAPALSMRSILFRNQADVRRYAHLFRLHGIEPGTILDPEYMRPGTDHFDRDRIELVAASVRAYQLMEATLTARHRVTAPAGLHDPGTKIYLVLTSLTPVNLDPLREGITA